MTAIKFIMTERFKSQCGHKQKHKSQGAAEAHLRHLSEIGRTNMHTYFCRFCKHWHVGHEQE
jgi:hypothetical protein